MRKKNATQGSNHWAEGSVKNRVGRINRSGGENEIADTHSDAKADVDGEIVGEVRGTIQEQASTVCNPIGQAGQVVQQEGLHGGLAIGTAFQEDEFIGAREESGGIDCFVI